MKFWPVNSVSLSVLFSDLKVKVWVKVVDPTEKPPQERWYPPVDDPRFYKHPKPEEYVNYNEDPAYVCTTSTCIHEDKPVVVRGMSEWLITSNKALPRFADEETVDTTVNYTLPDLFPIAPTIDLHVDHNYTLDHNTGLKSGISHGHPHTIFITDVNHWNHDQRMARSLLFSLGYAIAQAHRQYGLNTLAFDNDNGIKNIAWVDGGNHLFQKILSQPWMPKAIRDERLEDFDPAVFEKLLAVYLNGVPELMSDAV
nr:hypothetical protein BaRGS_013365 [Batillaria attramentaria]